MWLRLYTDLLNDPKVQRLAPEHFKGWVNLLCLAKENDGLLPSIEEIAFRLRTSDAEAGELIETLKARGLLDEAEGDLTPHNWATRQYETDVMMPSPSEKGAVGNHVRWHVGRGVLADDCIYCRPNIAATSPAIRCDIGAIRTANRAEAEAETDSETEAEQSRGDSLPALPATPAAAAAAANDFDDYHLSVFAFTEVEAFVIATKPHARNPGGLARKIWRSGEEDAAIEDWRTPAGAGSETGPKEKFCGECYQGWLPSEPGRHGARRCHCNPPARAAPEEGDSSQIVRAPANWLEANRSIYERH